VELFDRSQAFDDGTIESITMKWPNDVICIKHGTAGKVAGILVESEIQGERMRAVIGVGLNLRGKPEVEDREMFPPVSLLEGEEGSSEEFAEILIPELNRRINQVFLSPGDLLSDIRANFFLFGKRIEKDGVLYNIQGLGDDGSLILLDPHGKKHTLYDADWDRIIDT
jgi:biotin-(acetyl-CoA carboxylase) ligase